MRDKLNQKKKNSDAEEELNNKPNAKIELTVLISNIRNRTFKRRSSLISSLKRKTC